jgi:hypothetical protein
MFFLVEVRSGRPMASPPENKDQERQAEINQPPQALASATSG